MVLWYYVDCNEMHMVMEVIQAFPKVAKFTN